MLILENQFWIKLPVAIPGISYLELPIRALEGLSDKNDSLTANDLQHLLYAALRPLYEDIREEVTEDSGVGAVRSDLKIPSLNAVIEAKCSRKSMNLKSLTE